MDEYGSWMGHYLKLWADSYALSGEIKGGKIPLNFKRLVVTSNYSIDEIFGADEEDLKNTSRKKHRKNVLV